MSASRIMHDSAYDEASVVHDFERTVLIALQGDALNRLPAPSGPDPLHETFFEVFEQCGRASPWPDVKMADQEGNSAGDVLYLSLELANAIFEYLEIWHNRQRRHTSLGMLTPIEFETRHQKPAA